jgi:succinoglycan biosynthesis transport protein ExoP
MYRAQARLQIEDEQAAHTDFKEAYFSYTDPEPYYQTQYRILQGRDLARRAVRRLKLETVPEFNGNGPTPTRLTRVLETIKAKALAPFTGSTHTPAEPITPGAVDENGLVGAFAGRVQVAPVRGSRLVDVTFTSADPDFAAQAVNVLAEEYVQQNLEFRLENTKKTLDWLTREVARQQTVVQDSERLMAEYRENKNALSLEDRQNIVGARLNQVNDAVTRAKTQRVQREAAYQQIMEAKDRDALASIIHNPFIQSLKTRLGEFERDRVRLLERYGERHPQVQNVTSQIADTRRQIDAELDKAIAAIKNEYEAARGRWRASSTRRRTPRSTSIARGSTTRCCSARPRATARSTSRCSSARRSCGSSPTAAPTTCASSTAPKCRAVRSRPT